LLQEHALRHMRQRQVRDEPVLAVHGYALRRARNAPCHGVESVYDPLGFAGGAGGVDDGAGLFAVRLGVDGQRIVCMDKLQPLVCMHAGCQWERNERQAGRNASIQIPSAVHLADEQGPALAVQQDIAQGLTIEGGVHRNRYITGHCNGQVRQNPMRAVFADDGHTAAGGPTLALEPTCHAPHLRGRLSPRDIQHGPATHGL